MKRIVLAAAVAALASQAHAADPIKLGFMVGKTGSAGIVGEEQQRGLELALALHDNKLGGVAVKIFMEDDKEVRMTAKSDIPIGHKLALKDYKPGDTVIKYGVDIGKVVAPIARGEHTHVQNLKTKRW